MMNQILTEKEYQRFIIERLQKNGFVERKATKYDRLVAMDREMLFAFLRATQKDTVESLEKIYKDKFEETFVNYLNQQLTSNNGGLLYVLRHGIELSGKKIQLMYNRPATDFNPEATRNYAENRFTVMEEVWASDKERIDLVLFLNGLPIMTFELKCQASGQTHEDAIRQYREERSPKTRLFWFKAGSLVNFAMDLNEVYMTTKLDGDATYFLPFNMGRGEGINTGKGNPLFEDRYSVSYMWEDILTRDSIVELISRFMFVEKKIEKDESGKQKTKESQVFPRFHQRDAIHKILTDVRENHTSLNYLIQHSAGSGKTKTIAWLAHRLSSLHDKENVAIFDSILIVTDRVVVDRQLQNAIRQLEHKAGLIQVMDEDCTSVDLKRALDGNTKIIATTIQKFPYIVDSVKGMSSKKFAVIIDEAHSSTAGKNMGAVTQSLASEDGVPKDAEELITNEILKSGKQQNVSFFAFTATPKPTTLQLFGRTNQNGQNEPFHIYSMKQAIEEEFIIDVLQNYTEYDTYYKLNKEIETDPMFKNRKAKRKIAHIIDLEEDNITQRTEIIVEHFRSTVMQELGGSAKAMVVTSSREAAVRYKQEFENYIKRHKYTDIQALVAFSGKVEVAGEEFSEQKINGFAEKALPDKFKTDQYQLLLVANKYQTGFDEPKLCAMYVLKSLKDVSAVQTLSRLNRICPPFEKHTFVLDFVNKYEDIVKSFSRYYECTILANTVKPSDIYQLETEIEAYNILDPIDIDNFNDLLYSEKNTDKKSQTKMIFYINRAKEWIEKLEAEKQEQFIFKLRHFVRFYEFLLQASGFEDRELHKEYNFISYLLKFLKKNQAGKGFDLRGLVKATNFVQKKGEEHTKETVVANPFVKLAEASSISEDEEKKLSEIIQDINSRTGHNFDSDVVAKSMLQIKELLLKSQVLRESAKSNTEENFEFSFFSNVDQALEDGWEQNKDFFGMLLENEELKKQVLGIFVPEIYKELKKS